MTIEITIVRVAAAKMTGEAESSIAENKVTGSVELLASAERNNDSVTLSKEMTKARIAAAVNAGRTRGRVILKKVRRGLAPNPSDASSMDGLISVILLSMVLKI